MLEIGSPARSKDWDSFLGSRRRSRCGCCGYRFIDLDSPQRFPCSFLGFLLRSWIGSGLSLACLIPRRTGTSSGGTVAIGLATRRLGRDWDNQDRHVTFEARDGRNETVKPAFK
jgi:hypothetical protein